MRHISKGVFVYTYTMEFRKLIGFGKSSLVISIPKFWALKHNVAKGDLVYLKEDEDNLILSPKEKELEKNPRSIVILADGKSLQLLETKIIAAYLSNYDIIEIKGEDLKEKAPYLKTVLQNLAGIELLDQTATKIVAKDLMDLRELSVETLIRRIDIIIRSMFQDLLLGEAKYIDSITQRDKDVNRLVFLLKRVIRLAFTDHEIAKSLGRKNKDLLRDWSMVILLESVGDEVKRISRFWKEADPKDKPFKNLMMINFELNRIYLELMKAYHTDDKKLALDVELGHKKRIEEIDKLMKSLISYPNAKVTFHIKSLASQLKNMARHIICE